MLNKGGNLIAGKQFTDLTKASALKDSDIIAVHDGNGLKRSNMEDVTAYMSDKFSNPNLLINPDFKINQRGQTTYTKDNQRPAIYTVDRWSLWNGTLDANSMLLKAYNSGNGLLMQIIENKINGIATVSFEVSSVSGTLIALASSTSGGSLGEISVTKKGIYQFTVNGEISDISFKISAGGSVTIAWAKLERGSIATPFVAPNPTEELVKCKRFFYRAPKALIAYGINDNLYIESTEVMNMRDVGTVVIEGDGGNDSIRYEGYLKAIHFDKSKCSFSKAAGYIKVVLSPSDDSTHSKVVALDINNFSITIDAEIY